MEYECHPLWRGGISKLGVYSKVQPRDTPSKTARVTLKIVFPGSFFNPE